MSASDSAMPSLAETALPALGADVAEAMRTVLEAERDAADRLERCSAESRTALESARAEARRITARGEETVQAINGRVEAVATARAERRRKGLNLGSARPDAIDVSGAVARLAARMTGAGS